MSNPIKKNLSFFLFILLISLLSCESSLKELEGLRVANTEVSVDCKDSVFIGATSGYEISYQVNDPFIAFIEGDYIKGKHVGKTTISAYSNGETENIEVNVLSVMNLFEYPIDYTKGKDFYRNKYKRFNLKYQDDSTLFFFIINYEEEDAYFQQFNFNKENTLKSTILVFVIGNSLNVYDSLMEHFDVVDYTDKSFYFINSLESSIATEYAILELDRENDLCYAFISKFDPI